MGEQSLPSKTLTPITVQMAKRDLMISVMSIQSQYDLPYCFVELLMEACLSDISDCVNKELLESALKEE